METVERCEFTRRYGVSPARTEHLKQGEVVNVGSRKLRCIKNYGAMIVLEEVPTICHVESKMFVLDLQPHWERGSAKIKLCHEGVLNLIGAVYRQAENDYEELYLKGSSGYQLVKQPWENNREFAIRQRNLWTDEMKSCEEFLGKIYTNYAKVRALWRITHNPNEIAAKIGDTPEHVSCVIDRLGLNRPD